MIKLGIVALVFSFSILAFAQTNSGMKNPTKVPPGYWPLEKSQPIIDKSQSIRLAPDLSRLTPGERKAVEKLLEVGKIFHRGTEKKK